MIATILKTLLSTTMQYFCFFKYTDFKIIWFPKVLDVFSLKISR